MKTHYRFLTVNRQVTKKQQLAAEVGRISVQEAAVITDTFAGGDCS